MESGGGGIPEWADGEEATVATRGGHVAKQKRENPITKELN